MSCGVGCRHSSDPTLLWLWHRPMATARIRPLAWEPPYAAGVALEKAKRQKKKKFQILRVPIVAQQLRKPTSIQEDGDLIPGLSQWVKALELPRAVV